MSKRKKKSAEGCFRLIIFKSLTYKSVALLLFFCPFALFFCYLSQINNKKEQKNKKKVTLAPATPNYKVVGG